MIKEIQQKLTELEQQYDITILFACESGSRAWGFASPDSDFDVRFIYIQNPTVYLEIDEPNDTLNFPINDVLDISGWDLRKTLKLLRKSNMPLYEWLQSPIVYQQRNNFLKEINPLLANYFSPRASMHHYLSLTNNCIETELQLEKVKLKKHFYALRSILAAKWIAEYKQYPPMEFSVLRTLIADNNWQQRVDDLLEEKTKANEGHFTNADTFLNTFIASNLTLLKQSADSFEKTVYSSDQLNHFFRRHFNGF